MDELLNLIDDRISKYLGKIKTIDSKPAIVKSVQDNMVTVTVLDTQIDYNLPNRSGTFINIGDEVQVCYKGNTINERFAYINVSPNSMVICSTDEFDVKNAKNNILYFLYDKDIDSDSNN